MTTLTQKIKGISADLGFSYCGIATCKHLDEDAKRLEAWLNKGYHGAMGYMENHFDLRVDPRKLVPGAKSVITLLFNYFPEPTKVTPGVKIAKYAYGEDYHEVIREKLREFLFRIKEITGNVEGRGFVDSAPVLERAWARESGLGWIGKNSQLITKKNGSFFFIATLVTDLMLDYDDPYAKDFCGSCTKCIDACPTEAIAPDKTIIGNKCISYFTIELKEQTIPSEMKGKFDDWVFGCDTCQDICPWNRFSKPTNEPRFSPIPALLSMNESDWLEISEESFKKIFRHSPIKRTKHAGMLRNLKFNKS